MNDSVPHVLIVRYLSNQATDEETERLLDWVAADSTHHRIFTEWADTWERGFPDQQAFNLHGGLQKVNERIDVIERDEKSVKVDFKWLKIAASVAILIASGITIMSLLRVEPEVPLTLYKTPPGNIATIILGDSSRVTLNQNSSIQFPPGFSGKDRRVILDGEAFFEVTKDAQRPFIIQTGKLTTQVLGTSFNIHSVGGRIAVSVVTGIVKVTDEDKSLILRPFEKVIYSGGKSTLQKKQTDLAELAWKYPALIFQDSRLADVATSLEKHFHVSIAFEKDDLKRCLFTGKFKNEPLDKVLTAISYSTGLQFSQSGRQYVVRGKGCE